MQHSFLLQRAKQLARVEGVATCPPMQVGDQPGLIPGGERVAGPHESAEVVVAERAQIEPNGVCFTHQGRQERVERVLAV